jgi:hypothetical protein
VKLTSTSCTVWYTGGGLARRRDGALARTDVGIGYNPCECGHAWAPGIDEPAFC